MNSQPDKFKAVWLSHSSIADFLKCPRLYYLRSIYKDPRTGHKITVMSPPLALGQAVHEVIESLSVLGVKERFNVSPLVKFEESWEKIKGEKGGFVNAKQESEYKERGKKMLERVIAKPGPIAKKAIKIKTEDGLPYYWFSESENIILCGKVDWLEYIEDEDSVQIIDFKTGRHEEDDSSLQLPIYLLLVTNTQSKKVKKASYWYLDKDNGISEKKLPSVEESIARVEKVASRIKLSRQLGHFKCQTSGCKYCYPMERVFKGEGKWVGTSEYNQDIYILK